MGVEGKGKADPAGDADVKAFDARGNVRVGGEVLGRDGVALNRQGTAGGIEDEGAAPGKFGEDGGSASWRLVSS